VENNSSLGEGIYSSFIPKEKMKDYLHPTREGYRIWAQQIVRKLQSIL